MFQRPLVAGISMQPLMTEGWEKHDLLARSGRNSGNILFGEAVLRVTTNGDRCTSFRLNLSKSNDALVLAAANWINPLSDLSWINYYLERTDLPLVVVGLGAQAKTSDSVLSLKASTVRFLEIVAERSKLISIRGDFTRDVLERFGLSNLEVTGCPSLLLVARPLRMAPPRDWSDVALHGTRSGNMIGTPVQQWIYQQAMKHGADIVFQSEQPEIHILAGEHAPAEPHWGSLETAYASDRQTIVEFIRRHGHVYWEIEPWVEHLASKRLVIGSRIHGTAAALLAGTPAMLITHDARTIEMAKSLNIPYVDQAEIDISKDLNPADYYDPSGLERFANGRSSYLDRFRRFFESSGISTNLGDRS
jgi:hypothetical protein